MNKIINDIFIKRFPTLDLHGYDRDGARVALEDFIIDNIKLRKRDLVIVHGIGLGILRREVHNTLKNNKYVLDYKLHVYNSGCTIVKLVDNKY